MLELVPQPANAVAVKPIEVLLITTKQAAEFLQISERTVHSLIANRQLPSIKIGKSRRIFTDDLRTFARTGVDEIKKANESDDEDAAR
jgi:excisionase family DNA binding protein